MNHELRFSKEKGKLSLRIMRKFLIVFILNTLYLILYTPAYAGGIDLSLYPPVITIEATGGATLKTNIILGNLGEDTQTISYSLTSSPFFSLEKDDRPLTSPFMLRPHEQAKITLITNVPKDSSISGKDYYHTLVFQTAQNKEVTSNQSKVEAALGTYILLAVYEENEPATISAHHKGLQSKKTFFDDRAIQFSLPLENTGPHFFVAKGEVRIKDSSGKEVGRLPFTPTYILSGKMQDIASGLSFRSKDLFGKYEATAIIILGNEQPMTASTTFYAIPKEMLLPQALGAIFLLAVVLRTRSYWKKRYLGR